MNEMIRSVQDTIHRCGFVPSLTALGMLMLDKAKRERGPLTEEEEIEAMEVAWVVDHLDLEILVLLRVRWCDGPSTVLVSLRTFPDADLGFAMERLAPLDKLGSTGDRRDALEIPVAMELQRQLPDRFRVSLRPNQFHGRCNDIVVIGPGNRTFDIEVRNRRSDIHDNPKPRDQEALERDRRLGITFIFVVPQCTQRFHRLVTALGGIVIETDVYLVGTEAQRELLAACSWMCRTVELSAVATPRIAARLAEIIAEGTVEADPDTQKGSVEISRLPVLSKRKVKSETRRLTSLARSNRRLDRAEELCRSGITTMEEAANLIPISRRTLIRDLDVTGRDSPWPRGGNHSKADPGPK